MTGKPTRPPLYVVSDDHAFIHEAATGRHGDRAIEVAREVLMAAFAEGTLGDLRAIAKAIREHLGNAQR